MPDPGPADVHVVLWNDSDAVDPDDADRMAPASPRHATGRPTRWQRTITTGQEALLSASEVIAGQVDLVAERMTAALEQRDRDRLAARAQAQLPDPLWQVSEVEVSFGVQLTGEVALAVFSGSGESSAQITLTFARSDHRSS